MRTAYDLLGITPAATRAELDAAYAAQLAATERARVAHNDVEGQEHATQRRAELALAYRSLRPALTAPPRLAPADERRRDRQTLWALLALVVIAALVPLLRNVSVPQQTVVAEGADTAARIADRAPDFQLQSLDGTQVRLADFKGRVVLVNFWATWCPPCVREIPRLVRIYDQYRDQGFVVLGINTTLQDDRAKVTQFVRDQGISYPILLDITGTVGQAYGSRLMPSTYIIDRDGKIVYNRIGEVDEAPLAEQVRALLSQAPTASQR